MRITLVVACVVSLAVCTGCAGIARAPVVPAAGFIYTDTHAPLDIEYDNTDLGAKSGQASSVNILGLVAIGDASIGAAAKDGNITVVKHADYQNFRVLGVYSRFTITVYGD